MIWVNIVPHIAKGARYTIGSRIENKFLDLLELAYIAYFTEKEKKAEKISDCILVLDTLKFLISVAWEGKLISNKQCEDIALKLGEVGKMFGGWKKNLSNPEKKNRDVPSESVLCGTSSVTLSIWPRRGGERPDCILFVIENQPTRRTKYFLFC